jgi:WD repeat-containing protein 68
MNNNENFDNYIPDGNDNVVDAGSKQIYSYTTNYELYSMSFQFNNLLPRFALGSYELSNKNYIEIVEFYQNKFKKVHTMSIEFPCTKLKWSPFKNSQILAASSDAMRIYSYNQDYNKLYLNSTLVKNKQFSAPITSFDFNVRNEAILGTVSIDTTATIWDIKKSTIIKQIIVHDKDVYDICFSKQFDNFFITAGADGSIRGFDLRNLNESDVLFETQDLTPITRIAFNPTNDYFISALCLEKNYFHIIDIRKKEEIYATYNTHTNIVNAMVWSPVSQSHLCTVGDDKMAYMWEIVDKTTDDPFMSYRSKAAINNVDWSEANSEWLGIVSNKELQLLMV